MKWSLSQKIFVGYVVLVTIAVIVLGYAYFHKTTEEIVYDPMSDPKIQQMIKQLELDTARLNAKISEKDKRLEAQNEFTLKALYQISQSEKQVLYYYDKIKQESSRIDIDDVDEIERLVNQKWREVHK